MPPVSLLHEAPLEVLRTEPRVVLTLLRVAGRRHAPPATSRVEIVDSELTEALPAVRRADLVATVRLPNGSIRETVIVEIQREIDTAKLTSWPLYVVTLCSRYRVPCSLIVLAFDRRVAAWAARAHRPSPNMTFTPTVVGPDALPEIESVEQALGQRDLALITALTRIGASTLRDRTRREEEVLRVFEALLRTRASPTRRTYLSLLHGVSRAPLRAKLESLLEAHGMGALEIIRAEGKAEGKVEGKVEGKAEALLHVLAKRGWSPTSSTRAKVLSTKDLGTLDRWLDRALEAQSMDDVFTE
jgi:hypothetical protein